MSAGLRAAIIAVREFPPMDREDEKVTDELETNKSHTGVDEILHDCNPRAWEMEARGQSSRPAWDP